MALAHWRAELIADLGGEDGITTQQRALIEMAVRTWLFVGVVDDLDRVDALSQAADATERRETNTMKNANTTNTTQGRVPTSFAQGLLREGQQRSDGHQQVLRESHALRGV